MIGEGASVLVPEFLLVSEVILELTFLCRCGVLVADAAVSSGPRANEEAAGVFGIGAFGKSSPNQTIIKFD